MKKLFIFISILVVMIGLASCTGEPSPTAAPTAPVQNSTATPTNVPEQATATAQPSPSPIPPTPIISPEPPTASPTATEEAQATPEFSPTPAASPTSAPASPTTQPTTPPAAAACVQKAAFIADVTIPDGTFFGMEQAFVKTWRIRNEGTCTWTADYQVSLQSGDSLGAPLLNPLGSSVAPGEMVDISLEMTSPNRGGQHYSNWWFIDPQGQPFGLGSSGKDMFWVIINVRYLNQDDQPNPDPVTNPVPPVSGCSASRDSSVENTILTLINNVRSANGLQPLTLNPAVAEAAYGHSLDMACNNFISHTGSNGSSWYDRITAQGVTYGYASENIAVGNPQFGGDANWAFNWWMNSQVHRDNILSNKVTQIGVGFVYAPNSEYGGYYTVNFIR